MEKTFKEKWFTFWAYMFNTTKKELAKPNDVHIQTETSVKLPAPGDSFSLPYCVWSLLIVPAFSL